ncbi:WD repeat-containing protein 11-like [Impatiens glandulifera]|uniref:WD repeat-containing protein 11-like n=1 Tax=Impatiens glandulifera TaxID=253017 RepID=UPI001FB17158|nr:WD repeat-containing protein 11-like [Impatiens glandulifera]
MERSPNESWDGMLPGPPSRSNGGAADLSPSGLLAYATGSSVAVVDSRSMQLVSVVPLPPPSSSSSSTTSSSSTSLSPFVTSVRWSPQSLRRDILSHDPSSSTSHLLLAAGDRQGRIILMDLRMKSSVVFLDFEPTKLGIQDLCWIQTRHDSWILAALSGPSYLSLYNIATGRCFFRYDSSPEYFSCIRQDPYDSRHLCALGLKGFLLSVVIHGEMEKDVSLKELKVRTDSSELQKLEAAVASGGAFNSTSPALAVFPTFIVRFAFSPHWRHILFVTFPRELVVFDLQYKTELTIVPLSRSCGKLLDVVPDPNLELLYCAHLDGRLSTWRRKEEEQGYSMCGMEELVPAIATSIPSPCLLAVALIQSDCTFQNVAKLNSQLSLDPVDDDFDTPLDFDDEPSLISKTHLISITDDGKIWNWLLTAEGPNETENNAESSSDVDEKRVVPDLDRNSSVVIFSDEPKVRGFKASNNKNSFTALSLNPTLCLEEMIFKISLVGQLHLLSATVTILAVPSPSLTAILARGGNRPAVAVPLVALGTQTGIVDVIDVCSNAVAVSFSVHTTTVRGLRWLGNSKLVSFSYSQGTEKSGAYTNNLAVTCLRSGTNRPFRVLQKPERAPIRALRSSSSGRYLLILFRDAPVEVWAMTKIPIMLRSLALPFTVLEWTLPTVPRPTPSAPTRQWSLTRDRAATPTVDVSSPKEASTPDSKDSTQESSQDEFSESFAFALVNGALGVFEVQGRRIRDFRPKWPSSSFVSTEGLITAMAYRLPHVVMGDRSGNIRWWDVTTGQSSSFGTHRDGIRRIKFSPIVPGDRNRGRIAVLFYDNTFSVFDLDSPDPLANSLLQPQFPGTLVLEMDWLPVRTDKNDPMVLCIAGADSSFRLIEVDINEIRPGLGLLPRSMKERFRPMPLCSPILLPTPHALALRMILQLGVKPSWLKACNTTSNYQTPEMASSTGDLRGYMIDSPPVGDSAATEMLLKVLDPYRKEDCILDDERARLYASIVGKGSTARFAFAAAIFGDTAEALFWLKLRYALNYLLNKLAIKSSSQRPSASTSSSSKNRELDDASLLSRITSKGKSASFTRKKDPSCDGQLALMAFGQAELWGSASERIPWHDRLNSDEDIQNRIHELVSVGNLEMAVSILLSTHPESTYFYPNALRAVALSAAVSRSLLELAVKVVAANMVRTDRSLSGTHLLCAVGKYQEACSQLQDAGQWTDAATLAARHLTGSDYSRVLHRWAGHVLHAEHNIWRALILYVAAGSLQDALMALRDAQQPDTAAMFMLACHEIYADFIASLDFMEEANTTKGKLFVLPGLDPNNDEVIAVGEYYGQYQRKLIHLCMDSQPFSD